MKTILLVIMSAAIGGIFFSAITYKLASLKWHELGMHSGEISGRLDMASELCRFKSPGKIPKNSDHHMRIKYASIDIVRDGDSIRIYCQGLEE